MLPEWIILNRTVLLLLGSLSVLTFIGTLVTIPMLVIRLPTDYFLTY